MLCSKLKTQSYYVFEKIASLICGQYTVYDGVKQGCVMAPTTDNIQLDVPLHSYSCDDCFSMRYRVDDILFNLRLQAKSKILIDVLDEVLYADRVAKNVLTEKMQETMDRVSQACMNANLGRKRLSEVPVSTWTAIN